MKALAPKTSELQSPLMRDARAGTQRSLQAMIDDSPRMVAQCARQQALGIADVPAAPANHTGLPEALKSGIEGLAGISMDHVTVHRNSSRPAQLNAHAFAQGSEIHLGPGQEQHLPHEAWHIVQQAQGRVQATKQAQGADINDDPGLEQEASTMGERALQMQLAPPRTNARSYAPSCAIVQRARYLKALQTSDFMAGEITRLNHVSPLDAQPGTLGGMRPDNNNPIDINQWLSGGAGISTTHYNPGQMQYYSPVGFIVDVEAANVLGNFAGDGNTSTLGSHGPQYLQAIQDVRTTMLDDEGIGAAIAAHGYAANFAVEVTDLPTARTLNGRIDAFLADAAVAPAIKTAAIVLIKTTARAALLAHYAGGRFPLGAGGPGVLADLEAHLIGLAPGASYAHPDQQGREVKYTESQVHATVGHVVATYYATEAGAYPDIIDEDWRVVTPTFLAHRALAAQTIRNQLVGAGNANVELNHLAGGQLTPGLLAQAPAPPVPVPLAVAEPLDVAEPIPAVGPGPDIPPP
jgi:hypothetical protein